MTKTVNDRIIVFALSRNRDPTDRNLLETTVVGACLFKQAPVF